MNLYEFDDRILKERNGRKPVYINKHLAKKFKDFCKSEQKEPAKVVEYLISLGMNSVKHYDNPKVSVDISAL
jgi:protein involved in sex pheromone biosynthesis